MLNRMRQLKEAGHTLLNNLLSFLVLFPTAALYLKELRIVANHMIRMVRGSGDKVKADALEKDLASIEDELRTPEKIKVEPDEANNTENLELKQLLSMLRLEKFKHLENEVKVTLLQTDTDALLECLKADVLIKD